MKQILVAIDGPTGSGKTVCGRLVAERLKINFLDTGLFYRLFALYLIEQKIELKNLKKREIDDFRVTDEKELKLKEDKLQTFSIEQMAKNIALDKRIREKITQICQKIISRKSYLLVGRDTTTIIAPDADIKFFLDVNAKTQVQRKLKIFTSEQKTEKDWKKIINETNKMEKTRKFGALTRVPDAHYIRNEHMTVEEIVNKIIKIIRTNLDKIFNVLIVGPTNAGKSTLFNNLIGKRVVITSKQMHTTRDWFAEKLKWNDIEFQLIDSGGVENEEKSIWQKDIDERTKIWIDKADLILFVVDHRESHQILENYVFQYLKRKTKEMIFLVNKIDQQFDKDSAKKWKKAPTKNILYISARRKNDLTALKDMILKRLFKKEFKNDWIPKNEYKILFAGRTNAGKSTLFNQIIGLNQSIVSSIPNTTTNLVVKEMIWGNNKYIFYDSAGLRRKSKNKSIIEKESERQIERKLKSIDLLVLVIDLASEFVEQDKKIVRIAKDHEIPIIIIGNKIDIVRDLKVKKKQMKQFLSYIKDKELCFLSANKRDGINSFLKKIKKKVQKK